MALTPNRELGPLKKYWRQYGVIERSRWADYGAKELASRLSKRLSIPKKDAMAILRAVGQESGQMAREGWVFSIPHFSIFWTYITSVQACNLVDFKGQFFGGNKRLRMMESHTLKKQFKQERMDSEASLNKKPE